MVSIILRNKNESEYIGFTLQSICDYIPDAEVIVMDNNSTDDSLSVVSLFNE
jgi:glycosyltransferase involved in cell wall biosynthesis